MSHHSFKEKNIFFKKRNIKNKYTHTPLNGVNRIRLAQERKFTWKRLFLLDSKRKLSGLVLGTELIGLANWRERKNQKGSRNSKWSVRTS